MEQALKIQTRVDQALVNVVPALQSLLGHWVQVIALDLEPTDPVPTERKISFEEFLATRPTWPKDRPPVSLEKMEEAIIQGAISGANL
jgi:hypothetical protein